MLSIRETALNNQQNSTEKILYHPSIWDFNGAECGPAPSYLEFAKVIQTSPCLINQVKDVAFWRNNRVSEAKHLNGAFSSHCVQDRCSSK